MIVHEYAHIVGIGDHAVRDVRPRPLPVHVDARPAQGGVGEVAVMHGGLAAGGNVQAVQPLPGKLGGGGVKLDLHVAEGAGASGGCELNHCLGGAN